MRTRFSALLSHAGLCAALLAAMFAITASAATVVVTTANDVVDPIDGLTSLREAIAIATAAPGHPTVTFDPTIFATPKTISLSSVIDIGNVDIAGPAGGVTVSGGGQTSVFQMNAGTSTIRDLTITGGNSGILGGAMDYAVGAVVVLGGTLTMTACTLRDNGGDSVYGGGVYQNGGTVTLDNCTLVNNFTFTTGHNQPGGAAIFADSGTMTVLNCTIAFNQCTEAAAGGIFVQTGTVNLGNSIVANNTASFAPDIITNGTTPVVSLGYNLISNTEDATFTGAFATDKTGIDPLFDGNQLQNNGGATATLRLRHGSPAIDRGKAFGGSGKDQRGLPRPVDLADAILPNAPGGDGSDIGAFESQAVVNEVPSSPVLVLSGKVNVALSGAKLVATDLDGDPLTFALANGSTMPPGLTLHADGTITGTPTSFGQTNVSFVANDGYANSPVAVLQVSIAEPGSAVVNTDIDNSPNYDGLTSLREAIAFATGGAGRPTVTFDSTFFATPKTIVLSSAIVINDVDVAGAAAGVTVSGGGLTSVFRMNAGTSTIRDLTITGGNSGIIGGNADYAIGAVVIGGGTLTLSACTLRENGGDSVLGGAIFQGGGTATLNNCTLVNNFTFLSSHFQPGGAAINVRGGTMTILNCTIAFNRGPDGPGGGICFQGGAVNLGNSIVANNTAAFGPDILAYGPDGQTITNLGYNLITDVQDVSFTGDTATNLIGIDPQFDGDRLQRNGGPTATVLLLPGSPAIDAGKAMGGASTDQRGRPRPSENDLVANAAGGDGSDIGAFENTTNVPDIAVEAQGGAGVFSGASVVDLGDVELFTSADATFTIVNKGIDGLNLTGSPKIAVSGPDASLFSITAQPAFSLESGAQTTFTVRCAGTSTGTKSATLSIASDDPDENPFTFGLMAEVTDTMTLLPIISSPNPGDLVPSRPSVTYSLPELAKPGTVSVTFTSGTPVVLLAGTAGESAGAHTIVVPADLPAGTYTVTVSYQDVAGHPAKTASVTPVYVRPAAAVNTAVLLQHGTAPGQNTNGLAADALLASFGPPAIDDAGDIAFVGKWTSGAIKGTGLFYGTTCLAVVGGDAAAVAPGLTWKSFSDPVVSQGHLVCLATVSGPKATAAVIVGNISGAGLELIARVGDPAPQAGGAIFGSLKEVAIIGNRVAYLAQLKLGSGTPKVTAATDLGLWFFEPNNPLFAVREGSTVNTASGPKQIGTLVSFLPGAGSPGQGRGYLSSPPGADAEVLARVVFADPKKTQGIIVQNLDDVPDVLPLSIAGETGTGGPNIAGAAFAGYGVPAHLSPLTSAFLATLKVDATKGITAANARGIFARLGNGATFNKVVRVGDDAGNGAKISLLKDPVLSEEGDLAFLATLKGGSARGAAAQTIWFARAGQPAAIFAQGGQRPGPDFPDGATHAQWASFTSLAIGLQRGPIFTATLVAGKGGVLKSGVNGLWACDFTGAPRLLVQAGVTKIAIDANPAHNRMVKSFTVLKAAVGSTGVTRNFNNLADVVWLATFTDGSQGIVASEVP